MSHTKSDGILEQFFELPNIQVLYLNSLDLKFLPPATANYSSFSKVTVLSLGLSSLTEFPQVLRYQNKLQYLYLAGNHIEGRVPQWFVDTTKESLLYLNLSLNNLVGFEHPTVFLPWTNLEFLDLRGNKFRGPVPIPLKTLQGYDISNNSIHGDIPKQMCLANFLKILDLSNNSMSGDIPDCISHQLGNSLQVLNLRGNRFHGIIPQKFYKSCSLKMINLSDNDLVGQLPTSLAKCTMLEVLDLGKNRVNDTFPSWLGRLSGLQVLVLRHNSFHGEITDSPNSVQERRDESSSSSTRITISYLQSGELFFVSLVFNYVITITNKGSETVYPRILTVFRVVDFSNNNFTGEIPSILGDLRGLQALNLSNNHLEGKVPSSLSKMKDLQSLDLSENMLSGVIPQELDKLTFLEVFNVSYNRLAGKIPQGEQFDTFDNSSYDGNLALCGAPLLKKCEMVLAPPPSQQEIDGESEEDLGLLTSDPISWIVILLGCAGGFIVGFVLGKLYITDRHHKVEKHRLRGENGEKIRRLLLFYNYRGVYTSCWLLPSIVLLSVV